MRRVGLIVVPDVQMINFGALSVFELANAKLGEAHYNLAVMSERGGAVRNSFGMEVVDPTAGQRFVRYDPDGIIAGATLRDPSANLLSSQREPDDQAAGFHLRRRLHVRRGRIAEEPPRHDPLGICMPICKGVSRTRKWRWMRYFSPTDRFGHRRG